MTLNIKISEEDGEKLDLIAEQETRTRRGQATKMLSDAIRSTNPHQFTTEKLETEKEAQA